MTAVLSLPLQRRRWFFFIAMALVAAVAFARTAYFQVRQHSQLIAKSLDEANTYARAFEDALTQGFGLIERSLVDVAQLDPSGLSPTELSKAFAQAVRHAPALRAVAMLDAQGRVMASSSGGGVGRHVALDVFMAAAGRSASALQVGLPWAGVDFADGQAGVPGQPLSTGAAGFMALSREVALAGGRRVTVLAAVDTDFFIHQYNRLLDPNKAVVELLRDDGTLLLSTGAARAPGERDVSDLAVQRLARSADGRFEQRMPDGRTVLTAYSASRSLPLVIAVRIDRQRVLAAWHTEALFNLGATLAVLLAATVLASRFFFRLERDALQRAVAEAALNASEAQYRNTFEHAAVGIAHATIEGRFLRCNPYLCDMLGYAAEELARMTISQVTYSEDLAEDLNQRQRLLTGEISTYQREKRYLRKSGELVWARVNSGVIRDAAGALDYRVAVIEEIHLSKLTSLAMQALNTELTGEAFLRRLTQTLSTLLGVEFAFIAEVGPAPARRFNARAVCVDGQFVPDFSYELQGTPCETVLDNELCVYADQVQQAFPGDELLRTMNVTSYAAMPLRDSSAEGAPLGILAIMSRRPLARIDAVQALLPLLAFRARAELVREREAKKFRDLFDGSPTAIFLIDRQHQLRMCSRAGECLFGWASQALCGQPVGLLFAAHQRAESEALFQRFSAAQSANPQDSESNDMWALRQDGSTFPAQVHLRMLETAEGRMTVAHVQDITARKQVQTALLRLNEELESKVALRTAELLRSRDDAEQANRAKSAFLATMSHEIRTPMNGVVGMIDVLEQSYLHGEQVEIVKTARESAYALLSIVDDLLDFSKIEAGHFQVDSEPMDVAGVVEAVCDTMDALAEKKGVELTLFTDPAMPRRVLGDATRLRQVLLNLAGNAIKFSSAQGSAGRVCVRASVAESSAQQVVLDFSISDDGIGMDDVTLQRLFTPFTQADASTTRSFGGTGLGLSISHGLVGLMGGEITVRSERGLGSIFSVRLSLPTLPTLPTPATLAVPAAPPEPGADPPGLAGLRCLLLGGDAQGPADDLAVYLAQSGVELHRAPDVQRALGWLRGCAPGRCTAVLAGRDAALHDTLALLRGASAARADLDLRFVVIERGRRRGPRAMASDLIGVDGNVLHRSAFLKAVALAAGQLAMPSEGERLRLGAGVQTAPLTLQEASAQGRLILVAEDNEINQKVLRKQLALLGYAAQIVGTGREALECVRRRGYPLLLTDLHMPQMDGYELAVAIREAESGQRRMPIIALTANALKGEAKRCRDLGMDDYMTKPVQLADLKAMLCKWLPAPAVPAAAASMPPSCAPVAATPVLDVNVLRALVGDEPEVIDEFLHDFRLSAAQAARQIHAACQERQADAAQALAHTLKSSARAVGALALGELCASLEEAGQAGRLDALAELWPRFEAEAAAVDQFLAARKAVTA